MYGLLVRIYNNEEIVADQGYVCESIREREAKKDYTLSRAKEMDSYVEHWLVVSGSQESLSVYFENGECEATENG